ncbi:uncharacterized protein LOC107852729 isoform X1 [Capsicum annuum]|uniref:uncharacterized protein LOC107852729 isoform X1 n=1 Tax=Capsicum annuum TaxID=4072 RepID=UPI001FB0D84D|nr:uncharacterized protein LOC107852729 isoform X1 [Capsicum annuum]XP_047255143.1 uncharacterized protein LOC107852729 isoform X1 [Capsicum annuum]
MDLNRTLFLLRSYLRTRLRKIENYAFHIQKNADLWNRISKQEEKFAERCIHDMEQHLDQSILSKLPHGFKSHLKQSSLSLADDMGKLADLKQSSLSLADDMVPEPRLDQYVICRSKRYLGSFQLDDSGEEPVNIEANDLYALPYKSIKRLVESGLIDPV